MDNAWKLRLGLATLLAVSFSVLLWAGTEIFRAAPPMPDKVLSESGQVVYTRADMEKGRQVWQSMGGMQLGSIWGHGGYVAPDWSADWLHRDRWRCWTCGPVPMAAWRPMRNCPRRNRPRCATA
jgi:nitric oxide reductase subunit B